MTIADLTCAELTALYRRDALSPVEAARDVLARIEAVTHLNAFMPVKPEPVIEAAVASEARWRKGRPLGPLDGVPATVKDNIWLKGHPTRRGSKTTDDTPAAADSPAHRRACAIRASCLSARLASQNTAGSASAIRRSPASHAIHGIQTIRLVVRPAAARWPRCWAWVCFTSVRMAQDRCAFQRPSPVFLA